MVKKLERLATTPWVIDAWSFLLKHSPGWLQPSIFTILIRSANQGEFFAAVVLARQCLSNHRDLMSQCEVALASLTHPLAISAAWQEWAKTRSPELRKALLLLGQPAAYPEEVYVLCRLVLPDHLTSLEKSGEENIPVLVQFIRDPDHEISTNARNVLHHLSRPTAVNALAEIWMRSRDSLLAEIITQARYIARRPPEAKVATCLLNHRLSPILTGNLELLEPLLAACQDMDPLLSKLANSCVVALQNQPLIDGICALWGKKRDPFLEDAILKARYVPSNPPNVRLLVALKIGRMDICQACSAELVPLLLSSLQSPDTSISANARTALLSLNEVAQEEVCRLFLENDDIIAKWVAIQAGYFPRQANHRALFLFLTEQWVEYQKFDFDLSLLKTAFATAAPETRAKITEKIRSSGRLLFIEILSDAKQRRTGRPFNPDEADIYVQILSENHQYDELWASIIDLPPASALQALDHMKKVEWQPQQADEAKTFMELMEIGLDPIQLDVELPLALRKSTLHVHGRVNEVAFSPIQPWIAIGTGQRKVVLWDYQTGNSHRVLSSFHHSIGQVAFTLNGVLLVGERSNTRTECILYAWTNDQLQPVGSHIGSVTAIEPLASNLVLTAGKDGSVTLWNLSNRSIIDQFYHSTWPRHLVASCKQDAFALLTDSLLTYSLPDLRLHHPQMYRRLPSKEYGRSVTRCAAFSTDDCCLITGQNNGQVCVYQNTNETSAVPATILTQHPDTVQQVIFLPGRSLLLTAGAEGQVRFFHWPACTFAGSIDTGEGKLTALHVSHDGAFIATGTDESTMLLWDTRIASLPSWLSQPFSARSPNDLSIITSLLSSEKIPEASRRLLSFIRTILQHHYRYDIQLGEAISIQPGEFDILLE